MFSGLFASYFSDILHKHKIMKFPCASLRHSNHTCIIIARPIGYTNKLNKKAVLSQEEPRNVVAPIDRLLFQVGHNSPPFALSSSAVATRVYLYIYPPYRGV